MPSANFSRRSFIAASMVAGGGIAFDLSIPAFAKAGEAEPEAHAITAFVRILPGNRFIIGSKNAEIGQGAKTSLPMMIAEELDIEWAQVTVEQTHADQSLFGAQSAGGSRTTPREWLPMRQAGAAARAMLIAAAAKKWNTTAGNLTTSAGQVHDERNSRTVAYVDLASIAVSIEPPDVAQLKLKDPSEFNIIGEPIRGVDTPAIVAGQPLYGIDVKMPELLHAVFETCPAVGGRLVSANIEAVQAIPGISHVFAIKGDGQAESLLDGVAILAKSWWEADKARDQLQVVWDDSAQQGFSTAEYKNKARTFLENGPETEILRKGEVERAFSDAARIVDADYEVPFLAHGTLEPQNATALFKDGSIEIWAPTQNPEPGRELVARALGLTNDKIRINLTRIGGGFGRRLLNDYMVQAAVIASKVPGTPVKLLYDREDEFRRDFFRPAAWHRLSAALDDQGKLTAFKDHFVTIGRDGQASRGADVPAEVLPANLLDNVLLGQSLLETNLPTGWLRAPRSNGLGFILQGFLDEVALAVGKDLPSLMLELLAQDRTIDDGQRNPPFHTARAKGVIKKVLEMADWGRVGTSSSGSGKGFAFYYSHAGYFAEVVEVAVTENNVHVPRVWVTGDVGSQIINPLNALQQVEGAVIEGLGQALAGQAITQSAGAVEQTNFHTHPFQRIDATPKIEVEFVVTDAPPTGLGEPALPPAVGALGNAIYAATGKRVRRLPVDFVAAD